MPMLASTPPKRGAARRLREERQSRTDFHCRKCTIFSSPGPPHYGAGGGCSKCESGTTCAAGKSGTLIANNATKNAETRASSVLGAQLQEP